MKKTYAGGVLDETRHSFFTEPSKWQVVEERVDSSADAERQFVWGLRYVDDIVERDRDTTGNGSLDERLYGMQDANWNVTAVADTGGSVTERYSYDAYGTTTALTPAFAWRGASSYEWERRFAGYRYDREVQFYQVRNRMYSPQVGWLQRDPAGYTDGVNLYEYVHSNPLSFQDPMGLQTVVVEVSLFAAVVFGLLMLYYVILTLVGGNVIGRRYGRRVIPRFEFDLRRRSRCRPEDWFPPPPPPADDGEGEDPDYVACCTWKHKPTDRMIRVDVTCSANQLIWECCRLYIEGSFMQPMTDYEGQPGLTHRGPCQSSP